MLSVKNYNLIYNDLDFLLGKKPPVIRTFSGVVQGYWDESFDGRQFAAFEGIPYAEKPIGDLRFEV